MTHLEKYSEDIAEIACSGELFGVMRGDDSPSAVAMLFAKTAYSTMHVQTLTIGVLKINAASGLIPNADTKKTNTKTRRDRISTVSFCVNPPTNLW